MDYMNIEEEKQVKLVVLRFKRIAFAWWDQTIANRRKYNKRPVESWIKLKRSLKQRFLPSDYEGVLLHNTIIAVKDLELWPSMPKNFIGCFQGIN